jgi:hypothetical protein
MNIIYPSGSKYLLRKRLGHDVVAYYVLKYLLRKHLDP